VYREHMTSSNKMAHAGCENSRACAIDLVVLLTFDGKKPESKKVLTPQSRLSTF
jgi:hypothetical protein